MLGSALFGYTYRNLTQFSFGTNNPTISILPIDAVGRFFGAFLIKRGTLRNGENDELFDAISKTTDANSGTRLVVDLRKNGSVLATTQIWSKRQWRIDQRWGDAGAGVWRATKATGGVAQFFNYTPQPPVAPLQFGPWVFACHPTQPARPSYGNAYFPPNAWPGNAPSANPNAFAHSLAVHPEPFYVSFDRAETDTIDFLFRTFADRPNPALGNQAINDDAPPTNYGVRPAEVEIEFATGSPSEAAYRVDGWLVRISGLEAEKITAIPTGLIDPENPF